MKPAFSYIRFSTPEQAKGDSFRRQSEKADAWAKDNGYQIIKRWSDLGVSGYRGKNARTGGFGEFLKAAEEQQLPPGSVLLVENLDRVSREKPRMALERFLRVIGLGIGIVTLTDRQEYTAESIDADPTGMALFGSLMVMIRAHGESKLKAVRISASWSAKREKARVKGLPLSDRIPGWLKSTRDRSGRRVFTEDKDRADVVRRIFNETVQGFGRRAIAKGLNRDFKRSFLSESGWQPSSVNKILRTRTTVGEFQPHRRDEKGRRVPDGDPIKGYYPAVVSEELWVQANAAVDIRRKDSAGRPQAEVANLIRGLARCACGKRMMFLNKGKPPKGGCYYRCSAAARDDGCENKRLWNARDVERYLLHQIDPVRIAAAFEPSTKRVAPSPREYDLRIAELTAMKTAAMDTALRYAGTKMAAEWESRAESLVDEIADVRKRRDDAVAAERSRPHLPTMQSALGTVAALAAKLESSTDEEKAPLRTGIVQQLRTVFFEIVFPPHAIIGLIELPEKPKSLKGAFGLPKPIEVRTVDGVERYFLRHVFFRDDPEELATLDGGKAVVFPRFS
ncbi:DNA invertase Pin-like site-specific DNA recombinase [Bradyrhizobium japonicum]|uniref:recombinase family protein n=1 Tax=Bradyrhizobium japonicum TaxID=375 RepID=UPI00216A62C7|nr:recombinase family protein [Bradyrhizobium japonicum]MCS3498308.1 DNA invertase Pin-like site-specific DNA recombinase [Bradyrhizobium japonicum]MCS3959531.1 DNA invertase Pin-like site-specific DNA recombinase [Bradyrhizobium japonicum]MCS4001285.1 DNA invertase Pin-like site-specific DNA recombinase [Bradyrhizobium japonicum]